MTGAWGDDMSDLDRDDFENSPTKKAWQFMMANDKSPVISGAAIGEGGEGGIYSLANGETFRLSLRDCQTLRPGFPKWAFPTPASRDNTND